MCSDLRLVINAGPYVGYGIAGKSKTGGHSQFAFGDNRLKRFNYGVGAGAGLEIDKIVVGAGYDFGIADISDVKGVKVRNRNAYLTLRYKF